MPANSSSCDKIYVHRFDNVGKVIIGIFDDV